MNERAVSSVKPVAETGGSSADVDLMLDEALPPQTESGSPLSAVELTVPASSFTLRKRINLVYGITAVLLGL